MGDERLVTNTSQWSLVIHRVTSSSAEVWVGTLFPSLKMPTRACVELLLPDGTTRTADITKRMWKRPFQKMDQRFYTVCEFSDLEPGTRYTVRFKRRIEALEGVVPESWQDLRKGNFDTLPARLPKKGKKPFTIGIGSCFYNHRDGGQAADAYKTLYQDGPEKARPDVTFLTGDQVYLDIGFDSLSLIPEEIRQRIAEDYAIHWQALGSILSRGGTWMIPDDHEYWNDYPFYDSLVPTLLALKIGWARNAWNATAKDAVRNIQRSPKVETFSLGSDLSICLADLRSHRKATRFIPQPDFDTIVNWATALKSPGVFVSPQPFIVEKNKAERNLLSFPAQYAEMLNAFASSGHDIVILSGDVHFGRIATAKLGNNGARLIEIIASPLSNLSGLNGIATSTPKYKPKKFPDPKALQIPGWKAAAVRYDKAFAVETESGHPGSAYPRRRTKEHFMTVSFCRSQKGVELSADAWRIRERSGPLNMPVKDFKKTFTVALK